MVHSLSKMLNHLSAIITEPLIAYTGIKTKTNTPSAPAPLQKILSAVKSVNWKSGLWLLFWRDKLDTQILYLGCKTGFGWQKGRIWLNHDGPRESL